MSRGCARFVSTPLPNIGDDALGLVRFVLALHDRRAALPPSAGRLEHFLVPVAIEGDQRVRVVQNRRRRAVVVLEPHDFRHRASLV